MEVKILNLGCLRYSESSQIEGLFIDCRAVVEILQKFWLLISEQLQQSGRAIFWKISNSGYWRWHLLRYQSVLLLRCFRKVNATESTIYWCDATAYYFMSATWENDQMFNSWITLNQIHCSKLYCTNEVALLCWGQQYLKDLHVRQGRGTYSAKWFDTPKDVEGVLND